VPFSLDPASERLIPTHHQGRQRGQLRDSFRNQERLRSEAQRLRGTGVKVEEVLLQGSPSAALAGFAEEARAQLVVISSLGQIAPSRWFVGSVAGRVAQLAPLPTLVVRGDQAFRSWIEGERHLSVLVCFDFSEGSVAALRWAANLQEMGPCDITVASLASPPQETWLLGIGESRASLDDLPEVQRRFERELKERCDELVGKVPVRTFVAAAWGRTDSQLIQLARSEHADLMAVGMNRQHGADRFWFGSVSRGILHRACERVLCASVRMIGTAARLSVLRERT